MSKNVKIRVIITIIVLSIAQGLNSNLVVVVDQIHTAFPQVHISLVQTLVTLPMLLTVFVSPFIGWMSTRLSEKKLILLGCFIMGLSTLVPFLTESFAVLLVFRIIFGFGWGILLVLNTVVVAKFFHGNSRVAVMGIQGAAVGIGVSLVTMLSGKLAVNGYQNIYILNVFAFLAILIIALNLPDMGKTERTEKVANICNKELVTVCLIGFFTCIFIVTFYTNVSVHISKYLTTSTVIIGNITALFAIFQMIGGLSLGLIKKIVGKYMVSTIVIGFLIGAFLLVLFPDKMAVVIIGAIGCGYTQGAFVPAIMTEATNAVEPAGISIASSYIVMSNCAGQFLSAIIMNGFSTLVFGEVDSANVLLLAFVGGAIMFILSILWKKKARS